MALTLSESQTMSSIASLLYSFLPGKPHPYADQSVSLQGVAADLDLSRFWQGGSKLPALTTLLSLTLEHRREKFCGLVLTIVQRGLGYRNKRSEPVTRQEIDRLKDLVVRTGFKIPELWDPDFRQSLPSEKPPTPEEQTAQASTEEFKGELNRIGGLTNQDRGYAFEFYLKGLFDANGMDPRSSFRLAGEQIDGSFQLDGETYLVEAKWQNTLTGQSDLLVLQGKVEGKAQWSRGLFISFSGFTEDGLAAFSRGRSTRLVGMTGQDLYFVLEGRMTLPNAIRSKVRRAAETGEFFVSALDLATSGDSA